MLKRVSLQVKCVYSMVLGPGPSKGNYVFCVDIKLIRRHSLLLDGVLLPAPICQCLCTFYLCFRSIIPFLHQLLFLQAGLPLYNANLANEAPHWKNCMIYIYFFTQPEFSHNPAGFKQK